MKSLLFAATMAVALGAHAQSTPGGTAHKSHHAQAGAPSGADQAALTDGEVRKVDKDQGKLTLRHGPIQSLDMPAMTMVFRVADPKMLDAVKQGDKVRFSAQNLNGALTVTAIEPASK